MQNNSLKYNKENEVRNELFEIISEYQKPVPDILYHYTTSDGLLGILKDNCFWLTNAYYLNDSTEIKYGNEIIKKIIEDRESKYNDEYVKEYISPYIKMTHGFSSVVFEAFILCFCEKGDLLSQWRTYSSNFSGYSIGLETRKIEELNMESTTFYPTTKLRKVEYNENKQIEITSRILDCVHAYFLKIKELKNNKPEEDSIFNVVLNILLDLSTWFKHPSFSEEKEWRAVGILASESDVERRNIRFRAINNRLIPYIILKPDPKKGLKMLPIKKIVHAPSPDSGLIKKCTEQLCLNYGYEKIVIEGSNAPIRY